MRLTVYVSLYVALWFASIGAFRLVALHVISQVLNYTLVSDDGVIRPEIFYKALTLWVDRDVLGYAFSQVCWLNFLFILKTIKYGTGQMI